ncbi:alpha/beta hydrolase [Nocardiopsis gilva YIM 90087]|uniref:Alpha/beta hydrolase n=1 Tax=Nocardiopsis gilva YIM 90087 TaxID=1235441 RepID=A0A223SCP6_9ACTN|nr:alpha/beta hydrolase [Nocardiopsis gilva]ASU85934.1 alpha/beta hydrolase [Nocardiopsis gilva YIM 90087]
MGAYVQLGNVRTWYDERGEGEPLVLLHGGVVDARFFDQNIGPLVERFHVYAVDLRGHGHTGDVEGPFTYDALAQDTIEFIEQVVDGPAHLVGHSVGAAVSMFVTLRRSDLVRKLVMVSGGFHHSAEVGAGDGGEIDVEPVVAAFGASYGEVSPDGEEHYPVVVRKVLEMGGREPELKASDLGGITNRTLVMSADDDIVTLEHMLEMYRAIPNSELAIVPGTSHFLLQEKAEACNAVIIDFLANAPVPTVAPVRRVPAS